MTDKKNAKINDISKEKVKWTCIIMKKIFCIHLHKKEK
jgi:hypothetical protein